MDSKYALDEDGRLVEVILHVHHPADPPRGPPPPEPVNAPPPTSSSSSSETGSSTDCPRGPPPAPLSPQGIWKSPVDEVPPDEDAKDDPALMQTLMIKDALRSTTSTTSTTHTPDTNVRDMVNAQMVQGNMVDTVEVLRRLLDRQRHLRHCDRLIGTALEELLFWLRVPLSARPLNARTMENQIWDAISEQARHGSSKSVAALPTPREDPAVLLQPRTEP